MRVGIFGGSFNPIHNHHIEIAKAAIKSAELDEIWFIPAFQPVHKQNNNLLPFDKRMRLIELAISEEPKFKAIDIEKKLGGPSYTIRLVQKLKELYPQFDFQMIIGGDSLRDLPTWFQGSELARTIPFIVAERPGIPDEIPFTGMKIKKLTIPLNSTSSTLIRQNLQNGKIKNLGVPPATLAFIVQENLFECLGSNYSLWIEAVKSKLATEIPAVLKEHIQQVAFLAAKIAADWNEDPRDAYLAGLSHDIFRTADPDIIMHFAKLAKVKLFKKEIEIPMLAHGAAAAGFLMSLRPAPPLKICRAVRTHTFPPKKAAKITMILVIADALEPGRNNPRWDKIRAAQIDYIEQYQLVRKEKLLKAQEKNKKKKHLSERN